MNPDLELAERAARAAGEVLLSYYGAPAEGLASKSSATDPVSDADREAERTIRELLTAERPRDGLLGEEGSHSEARSGRRWLVDPLDGTVNFLYGFPAWCVSVALEDRNGLAAGVVHDPLRAETFLAARGEGALRRGGEGLLRRGGEGALPRAGAAAASALPAWPLRASGCTRLDRALVATGFSYEPSRRAVQAQVVGRVLPRVRDVRRAGSAALDLAMVAAGRVDAFYERGLQAWDAAAGRLLVEQAGGVTEELAGDPPGLAAAATPELLEQLGELVR